MKLLNQANLLEQQFKEKGKQENYQEDFKLRIHRSLSWLKKASLAEDLDIQFISLWISFNAAYANEVSDISGDRNTFFEFLRKICELDTQRNIYTIIWTSFNQQFKELLNTPYTFQPFWDYHNGKRSESDYLRMFVGAKRKAEIALKNKETHVALQIIFSHLYTLRNQIVHGGATFSSKVNRKQLSESCEILSLLIPAIIEVMMQNHNEINWGKPFYPVIKDDNV